MMERKIIKCKKRCAIITEFMIIHFNAIDKHMDFLHLYYNDNIITSINIEKCFFNYRKQSNIICNYYKLVAKEDKTND